MEEEKTRAGADDYRPCNLRNMDNSRMEEDVKKCKSNQPISRAT